jgi:HD superfamily phosphohydrolase
MDVARRIRENVHGTIDISPLEDLVIAHPYVQRLRRIKQLAFLQYVFPGASHSRFEHSLGVMHLAGIAWRKLADNQHSLANSAARYPDFSELESQPHNGIRSQGRLAPTFPVINDIFGHPYPLQALRLAALLHDAGHSPFSHSGEGFMPSWKSMLERSSSYPDYICNFIRFQADLYKSKGVSLEHQKVRHELYTLLMIDRIINDVYKRNPRYKGQKIEAQDIASIVIDEIPPVAGSILAKHGIQKLCHELVSGEFDVDRMDYLLRDSRECGVVYGIFDESRILNSLSIYWDDLSSSFHLAIQFSGLAAFEDYLRARHSMYLQLYFHKTSVAAEAMIARLTRMLKGWTLPLDIDEYAKIDETNFPQILIAASKKIISDLEESHYFEKLVSDLMYDRVLWKRVFEVASNAGPSNSLESIDEAATVIAGLGIRFEKVSSSNSLTRFRPRDKDGLSHNFLRLIKKDDFQFPRVIPIEDQMSLIDSNSQVHITRLYVESGLAPKSEEPVSELVKRELQKLVRG